MNANFVEEFDRLARTKRPTVTEEQVKELRAAVSHVFESHANRRNLLRRDLSEIAASVARGSRMGHFMESDEGLTVMAKVVGDVVSEMVKDALREGVRTRR